MLGLRAFRSETDARRFHDHGVSSKAITLFGESERPIILLCGMISTNPRPDF